LSAGPAPTKVFHDMKTGFKTSSLPYMRRWKPRWRCEGGCQAWAREVEIAVGDVGQPSMPRTCR
jgi:hypothetical protein